MTLGQFMNELKHTSIYISLMIEGDVQAIFTNTLGILNHWVDLPKFLNYKVFVIRPMIMLKGFHITIEEGDDE